MPTFNELLQLHGIARSDVALLRHAGRSKLGITPYDLWRKRDGSFELYECTQAADKAMFRRTRYWASFVAEPDGATLFLGLYEARLGIRSDITWDCPLTGVRPGADKGRESDLFHLSKIDAFLPYAGKIRVEWRGGERAWAQYASTNDMVIVGGDDVSIFDGLDDSSEGQVYWAVQRGIERDRKIANEALRINYGTNGGSYRCCACDFAHPDRAMFDAHHPHPLEAGPRQTKARELVVLCPTCHRRAHQSGQRLFPFSVEQLRDWVARGRP